MDTASKPKVTDAVIGTVAKKTASQTALCRYFTTSGCCMFGDDCQFLHEYETSPTKALSADGDVSGQDNRWKSKFFGSPPEQPETWEKQDGSNGDQFFSATFGDSSEYTAYGKNPKAGISDFIPKTKAVPRNAIGLKHSSSSPTFISPHGQVSSSDGNNKIGQPVMMIAGTTSPAASPRRSPPESPSAPVNQQQDITQTISSEKANANKTMQENVGGTTYFYNQTDVSLQQQGVVLPSYTVYANILPHVAHLKSKAQSPTFFMPDELKTELLKRHAVTLMQVDKEHHADIPDSVDDYHDLFPLEPRAAHVRKSSTFGYQTSIYKAVCSKDGLTYCLRRVHGCRWVKTKTIDLWKCVDLWKKIQHPSIVQLREVFTTKAFGDHSMVFVYDFYPRAETLMMQHFSGPALNNASHDYSSPKAQNTDKAKGPVGGTRQHSGLLPESLLWTYIIQLTSALRTIHGNSLACRVLDPTKLLLTDKSRLRLNCVGIFDVLSFESSEENPLSAVPQYQQEDLTSLGKVVLALACNSIIGIQRDRLQTSMEIVHRNYSADLKNLLGYLLGGQARLRCINDVMPMIGARFYTQLDGAYLHTDIQQQELSKEVENGRLFRLICKLTTITERPHVNLDSTWSENGDRYMLKLFRNYVFHQVDDNDRPWVDLAHMVQCMNKLDAGVPEKICLMSQDEQSVLVVTYAELKHCMETAFSELATSNTKSSQHS